MISHFRRYIKALQVRYPALVQLRLQLQNQRHALLGIPFDRDFSFLKNFRPAAGEVFIDVGANRGQSALCMRRFHRDVPIHSFEPLSTTFEILKRETRGMTNHAAHNVALGDKEGTLTLYVPTYDGNPIDPLASIVRSEAEEWLERFLGKFLNRDRVGLIETTARIVTLDSFNLSPAFLKLDVQGAEDRVLSGGVDTLSRSKPVILLERTEGLELASQLAPFGYEECHFDGRKLVIGPGSGGNTFFATPERRTAPA